MRLNRSNYNRFHRFAFFSICKPLFKICADQQSMLILRKSRPKCIPHWKYGIIIAWNWMCTSTMYLDNELSPFYLYVCILRRKISLWRRILIFKMRITLFKWRFLSPLRAICHATQFAADEPISLIRFRHLRCIWIALVEHNCHWQFQYHNFQNSKERD